MSVTGVYPVNEVKIFSKNIITSISSIVVLVGCPLLRLVPDRYRLLVLRVLDFCFPSVTKDLGSFFYIPIGFSLTHRKLRPCVDEALSLSRSLMWGTDLSGRRVKSLKDNHGWLPSWDSRRSVVPLDTASGISR